ncbi:hypothetical protein ABIB57_002487 [Devosia sp. UYZn731]|uniref:hypothetical protein n=1 Tax=Devosia sp. UYZn731 TaxID=3156345 RepID=UPI00339548CA
MTFKTVTCAIVMGSALLFGGAAYADTMVGASSVTDADLPAVQARCDQIAMATGNDSLGGGAMSADSTDSSAAATDASISGGVEKVDELAAATTKSIDLDTITAEQCTAAGLTK